MKQFVSPASWWCSNFTIIFHSAIADSSRKVGGNNQCSEEIATSLQNVLTGTLRVTVSSGLSSMKVLLQAAICAISFTFMNFTRLKGRMSCTERTYSLNCFVQRERNHSIECLLLFFA